jgi:hypothetical protein
MGLQKKIDFSTWIKKEYVWSFFLCLYLLFPLLNSFEFILYNRQSGSVYFILVFWIFLSGVFVFFPKFYDFTIQFMFSRPLEMYVEYLLKCALFFKNFPVYWGFFMH